MKMIVLAIKDRALDAYMRPFHMPTIGTAVRSFQDEINRNATDNPLSQHPEDYDLYELATFDEETGKFANTEPQPKQIAIGKQMIREQS